MEDVKSKADRRRPRAADGPRGVLGCVLIASALVLSSCSAISAVKKIEHAVNANTAAINSFSKGIKSGATTAFSATYASTGASPATVVYAVDPTHGSSFSETPSSQSASTPAIKVIVNPTGEFICTQETSAATWSCKKADPLSTADERKVVDFYTPSHWLTFLRGFSLIAGLAGDAVTSSSMVVNGFAMNCVNLKTPGQAERSTICTTQQGILGYVEVAGDSTSFEMTAFTSTPDPSLFTLPAGASVSTVRTSGS